jgi:cbb3-type cytochrome oxidase maturation protein
MSVIILLVVAAFMVSGGFLAAYFWATKDGQFDDTYTPAVRILFENDFSEQPKTKQE